MEEKLKESFKQTPYKFADYLESKGYNVGSGWKGQTEDGKMIFPTEEEYVEYVRNS